MREHGVHARPGRQDLHGSYGACRRIAGIGRGDIAPDLGSGSRQQP
jgi:hypothetical protein